MFGHLIEKIEIHYTDFDRWEELNRDINKYLANSLKEITLENAHPGTLEGLTSHSTKSKL